MRQKSETRKTGAGRAIKDIRRAMRRQYSAKKSAMCWKDCVARRASLSCAAVKASPRASITNGQRSFSRLASVGVPVIVIAPSENLFEKTASNMAEVISKCGWVIFLSDAEGAEKLGGMAEATIALPNGCVREGIRQFEAKGSLRTTFTQS